MIFNNNLILNVIIKCDKIDIDQTAEDICFEFSIYECIAAYTHSSRTGCKSGRQNQMSCAKNAREVAAHLWDVRERRPDGSE